MKEQLEQLKGLLDDGLITQEEYEQRRQNILDGGTGHKNKKMKKGKGCLIAFAVVIVLFTLIGILDGKSSKDKQKENLATKQTAEQKSEPVKSAAKKPIKPAKKETKKDEDIIQSGTYEVGKDVPAGEYKIFSNGSTGYVELANDASGSIDSIVFNDNIKNSSYIIIDDGKILKLKNCYAIPIDKAKAYDGDTLTSGMYKVGKDIQPGQYNITADGGSAYVEVTTVPHDVGSIVMNDNISDNLLVDVSDGQYLTIKNGTGEPSN